MDQPIGTLEQRIKAIEDRLEIYNLIASHPPSADTGADYYAEATYTEDGVFDRGPNLSGAAATRRSPQTSRVPVIKPPLPAASLISPDCLT
jgi:hypothetical protein